MVLLCVKLWLQCGNESKNRMYISKKLTLLSLTDGKKSKNQNEQLRNVTCNYQMSKFYLNIATLLNFHRPSLAYEISNNCLTSNNEQTV